MRRPLLTALLLLVAVPPSAEPRRSIDFATAERPRRWWLSLLITVVSSILLCAAVGALLGALLYKPDPSSFEIFTRGVTAAIAGVGGAMVGAIAGIIVWLIRTLRQHLQAKRTPTR
jgi:membrane associated rhomboid family serine protease